MRVIAMNIVVLGVIAIARTGFPIAFIAYVPASSIPQSNHQELILIF
ncbi:hypothetical protein CP8484711_0686 [Chlamydia psittaci 84-8471/1]|nr:hypothetical protein CP8484711_0686 [Chlamydia psittaci 84-8471/1]